MGIHWTGIVFGLGAIISMGYWTTDFLVVQRILAAKDIRSAELAPIIGAGFKMLVPVIVILPGLLGLAVLPEKLVPESVAAVTGGHSYNDVLPLMLARYCGPGLLGLGVTALIAGFMSGMAGNVSAFTTVWTYDIYRPLINSKGSDHHYVNMGRWTTVIGVLISVGTAYLVMQFASIMDYVQALFSFFIAPLFGTVVLGMLWKRATGPAGFWGLLCGTLSSISMWAWVKVDPSALRYVALSPHAKGLAQDMYQALWSFIVCVAVTVGVSLATKPIPDSALTGLVYGLTEVPAVGGRPAVSEASFLGGCGDRRFRRTKHYFLVKEGAQHDFDLVFHRHFTGGEWRADTGCRNLPVGESSGKPRRSAVQPACQRVVGRAVAGLRPYLLLSIQAGTPVLICFERAAIVAKEAAYRTFGLRPHLFLNVKFARSAKFPLGRVCVSPWPGTDVPAGNERRVALDPIPPPAGARSL